MNCENVRDELVAYIDGEPSPTQTGAITGHLAKCPGCHAESEKLRKVVEWTREAEPIQPTQDWWERLQERIHTFQSNSLGGRWNDVADNSTIDIFPK